jgi:hypothetical protein
MYPFRCRHSCRVSIPVANIQLQFSHLYCPIFFYLCLNSAMVPITLYLTHFRFQLKLPQPQLTLIILMYLLTPLLQSPNPLKHLLIPLRPSFLDKTRTDTPLSFSRRRFPSVVTPASISTSLVSTVDTHFSCPWICPRLSLFLCGIYPQKLYLFL